MSGEVSTAGWRVGWGFDAHPLDGEPPLVLGGVVVSEASGVSATSDGDVLAHALTDAVLGACSLGDIGQYFPSNHPSLQGANSMVLLHQAVTMAMASGWRIAHVDVTVVVESIRIAPHREAIREGLAKALAIEVADVSVKATTTDGLGLIGQDQGLAAIAVVTVEALP